MNLEIPPDLEDLFRKKAMEKFGYKRSGSPLTKAICEAIRQWVEDN